jgi:hypothetical protein
MRTPQYVARPAVGVGIVVSLLGALAACSSPASSGSGSDGSASAADPSSLPPSASTGPAVSAAKAAFQKYVAVQPSIQIPALPGKPTTGKTITIVSCPLPICAEETDPAVAAAKLLGWKVTQLETQLTPEGYQSTLNQVAANPTNFVAITPVTPDATIATQLAALKKAGSKIVMMSPSGSDPTADGPVDAAVAGPPQFELSGQLMGDAVVANADGAANTLFVWDPSVANVFGPVKEGYTQVVTGAGGQVAVLDVSNSNIGTAIPGQVTSYVQAHPDVKYIAFSLSDEAAGVPQALKAAGLSQSVKIVSRAPSATTLADIKNGSEWASVGEETAAGGYRVIDQFARMADDIALGDLMNPAGWHQIFIQSNVTETTAVPETPGFPDVFLSAWHLQS